MKTLDSRFHGNDIMKILDSRFHGNDKMKILDSRLYWNDKMKTLDSHFSRFRKDRNEKIEGFSATSINIIVKDLI